MPERLESPDIICNEVASPWYRKYCKGPYTVVRGVAVTQCKACLRKYGRAMQAHVRRIP